jgi:hypothetical protein
MQANWLDSGLGQIATTAIGGYQKYVLPHKGFSCAHRLLYGRKSCSQYVKDAIAEDDESNSERKKDANTNCVAILDSCSYCTVGDCSSADCTHWGSGLDCGAIDCSGLDCSAIDCSGLDCSGLDCGGCSW